MGLYPYNITLKNYLRYLVIPSVIYEQDFPSTKKFNVFYFIGHTTLALMNLCLQMLIYTDHILPIIQNKEVQWQLYNVSGLKHEFDLSHGIGMSQKTNHKIL